MAGDMKMKKLVQNMYDVQKLRIQMMNRLVSDNYLSHGDAGHQASDDEKKKREKEIELMFCEYEQIPDDVKKYRSDRLDRWIEEHGEHINTFAKYAIVDSCASMRESEQTMLTAIKTAVHKHPLWYRYLKQVKGCGEVMAAVLISEVDMSKTRHIGSLIKYAGLDTVMTKDGTRVGRSKKEESLEEVQYVAKDGSIKTKRGITYNPFLKTKLIGVLSTSFIKCGGPYRKVYDDYKFRLANSEKYAGDEHKGHRENMARRYCVKIFLKDLYINWWRMLHNDAPFPEGDWYEDKRNHPKTEPNYTLL